MIRYGGMWLLLLATLTLTFPARRNNHSRRRYLLDLCIHQSGDNQEAFHISRTQTGSLRLASPTRVLACGIWPYRQLATSRLTSITRYPREVRKPTTCSSMHALSAAVQAGHTPRSFVWPCSAISSLTIRLRSAHTSFPDSGAGIGLSHWKMCLVIMLWLRVPSPRAGSLQSE